MDFYGTKATLFLPKILDEIPTPCYHAPTMNMNIFSTYDSYAFTEQMPLACGDKVVCR
ncbi:hypothetical protein MNBD_CHLOROFLEXI01-784 [hydrothermal vent metagenome]|uniref:Uncharacterized protein n=1 Tax=hydrothermal vent metagenome TaxID=652676 RepID=A0A3B0VIE9_9ZZZZ